MSNPSHLVVEKFKKMFSAVPMLNSVYYFPCFHRVAPMNKKTTISTETVFFTLWAGILSTLDSDRSKTLAVKTAIGRSRGSARPVPVKEKKS